MFTWVLSVSVESLPWLYNNYLEILLEHFNMPPLHKHENNSKVTACSYNLALNIYSKLLHIPYPTVSLSISKTLNFESLLIETWDGICSRFTPVCQRAVMQINLWWCILHPKVSFFSFSFFSSIFPTSWWKWDILSPAAVGAKNRNQLAAQHSHQKAPRCSLHSKSASVCVRGPAAF